MSVFPSPVAENRSRRLEHRDGSTSPLYLESATRLPSEAPAADPVEKAPLAVLILPGIAVGAKYYLPVARAFAAAGIDAAITELRGQGESSYRTHRKSGPAGYHETAAEDVPLALDAMAEEFGPRRVVLLGHSIGSQLGVYHLARRDPRVAGLVAVAGQSPFHRGFPGGVGLRVRVGSRLIPALGAALGHVPEQFFGGQGRQPVTRMRDWAQLAGRGTMQPARADLDYRAALSEVTVPVLAVAMEGDILAPPEAAAELLRLMPAAKTRLEIETTDLGHNKWARTPDVIVKRVVAWLGEELDA